MGSQQPQESSSSASALPPQVAQLPKRPETQRIISGNNAEGYGIMYNGDLYEEVNNITYNNTFISNTYVLCLSETASQIRPTIDAVPGRLSSANGGASRDTTPRASPRPRGLSSPPLRPLSSSPKGVEGRPPSINIKLCGGQATAIVVPDVEGNWVRSDILKRMTAPPRRKSDGDIRRRRKAIFRNYSFESTGNFLELKCHRDKSLGSCRHRFYITDDQVGFDVLLGTDMLTTGATTAGVLNGISAGPMLTPGKSQTAPDTGNHNAQQKVLAWMNGVG